jgi:hypothetical protein
MFLDVDPAHSAVPGDDDGFAGRDAPYRMDTHWEVKSAAVTIDLRPLSESPPWRSELPEIAVGAVDRSGVADTCRTVIERAMTLKRTGGVAPGGAQRSQADRGNAQSAPHALSMGRLMVDGLRRDRIATHSHAAVRVAHAEERAPEPHAHRLHPACSGLVIRP